MLPDTVVYDLRHFEPHVIACDHALMVSLEDQRRLVVRPRAREEVSLNGWLGHGSGPHGVGTLCMGRVAMSRRVGFDFDYCAGEKSLTVNELRMPREGVRA